MKVLEINIDFILNESFSTFLVNSNLSMAKLILPRNPSQYWQLIFTVPKFIFIYAIIYLTVNNLIFYLLLFCTDILAC